MTVTLEGNAVYVAISPTEYDMRQYIKESPDGRRWDKRRRLWVLPATLDNMRHVARVADDDAALQRAIREAEKPLDVVSGVAEQVDVYLSMHGRTKPHAHQRRGLELLASNARVALYWEQGVGKTWSALHAVGFEMFRGNVSRALIVCPKTVIGSWVSQAAEHTGLSESLAVVAGTPKRRLEALQRGRIVLINYDLLRFMEDDILKQAFQMVVFDEAHYLKTATAARSKVAYKLSAAAARVIQLTGTPASQGPADLFGQFKILDLGRSFGTVFTPFRNRYFVDQREPWQQWPNWQPRPEMLPVLRSKVAARAWRLLKTECVDLPPKNYQVYQVDMTAEQRRAYKSMLRRAAVQFADGQVITASVAAAVYGKLSQITSGFLYDEAHRAVRISDAKLKVLRELVEDKPKAVVWCQYREDLDAVEQELSDLGVVRVDGSVSGDERTERIKRFQGDPGCRVFVGQIATGIGITLTAAQFVVYYSQGFKLVDRQQSEDRTHRIGTRGTVTYVDLVCNDSIDEVVVAAQKMKRTVAGVLTGDITGDIVQAVRLAVEEYKEARRR